MSRSHDKQMPSESPLVSCYLPPGYETPGRSGERMKVHVLLGDAVEWKQNGLRGAWTCRVIGWTARNLRVELVERDGSKLPEPLQCRIIKPWVQRIFRNGDLLLPPTIALVLPTPLP